MSLIYSNRFNQVIVDDFLKFLKKLPSSSFCSCIWDLSTYPTYNKNTLEKEDLFSQELLRVLKPGGHVLVFSRPKSNHFMKLSFESSGFRISDEIDCLYSDQYFFDYDLASSIPLNQGLLDLNTPYGRGASPWHETVTVFQKKLYKNNITNIDTYGCGALNIDACRIPLSPTEKVDDRKITYKKDIDPKIIESYIPEHVRGRFPSNIVLDEFKSEQLDIVTTDLNKVLGGSRNFFVCKTPSYVSVGNQAYTLSRDIEFISWLIKLITPKGMNFLDIYSGVGDVSYAINLLNKTLDYKIRTVSLLPLGSSYYSNLISKRLELING